MFEWIEKIDRAIANYFIALQQESWLTPVMRFLTDQYNFLIPLAAVYIAMIIWGGRRGRTLALLLIPLLFLTDSFTDKVLKPLFARPRPLESGTITSMPSAHACNLFGAATLFAFGWFRSWKGRVWLYVVAAIFASTRVYLAKHYLSDVIAGAVIGALDAGIIILIYSLIRPRLAYYWDFFDQNIFIRPRIREQKLNSYN